MSEIKKTRCKYLSRPDFGSSRILGTPRLRDSSAAGFGSGCRKPSTLPLSCVQLALRRGIPPMYSPAVAPKMAVMAKTQTVCSTTINSKYALKPSPDNIQDLYLGSSARIGYRHPRTRYSICRRQLGITNTWCLGSGLGSPGSTAWKSLSSPTSNK